MSNNEDVSTFQAITGCDENVARNYLNNLSNLNLALETYFRLQEANPPRQVERPSARSRSRSRHSSIRRPSQPARNEATSAPRREKKKKVVVKAEKKEKESVQEEQSEPESDSKKQEQVAKRKRKFNEMIKSHVKEDMSEEEKKKAWPKYLGSLKGEIELSTGDKRLKSGDEIKFKPEEIGWSASRFKRTSCTYSIRGSSLYVSVFKGSEKIGILRNAYEEIFVFLLHMNYVQLQGTVIEKSKKLPHHKEKRYQIRIDILLKEEAVSNPLNAMTKQRGRKSKEEESKAGQEGKKKKKVEEEETEEEQKLYHLCRYSKESLNKLFEYLKLKLITPAVVQLKKKTDPFNPLRREKYSGWRDWRDRTVYHIPCNDSEFEPITTEFPQYFSTNKKKVVIGPSDKKEEQKEAENDPNKEGKGPEENSNANLQEMEEENLAKLEQEVLKKFAAENYHFDLEEDMNSKKEPLEIVSSKVRNSRRLMEHDDSFDSEDDDDDDDVITVDNDDDEDEDVGEITMKKLPTRDFYNPFSGMAEDSTQEDSQAKAQEGVKSHLNDLFNLQNQNSNSFRLSEPPKTFKTELHPYQKQALTWMKYREGCLDNQRLYNKLNEELRMLNDLFEEYVLIDGSKLYFNPFNGAVTVDFPIAIPTRGGILADEMGLGKTIMTLALIHSHRRDNQEEEKADEVEVNVTQVIQPKNNKKKLLLQPEAEKKEAERKEAGTLIVVPLSVITQWEKEIKSHSEENAIKVTQYYGTKRNIALDKFDVILTTYGTLASDFTKSGEIHSYKWFRIILDECHNIKERSTGFAKATCAVDAQYRWCLSGTPIHNKMDDLYSLIKFLRVDTWGEYPLWNCYINKHSSTEEAYELIRGILKPILLRRTKKSTYSDGRNILELPAKDVKTNLVKLTSEERQVYSSLFNRGSKQFNQIVNGGTLQYEYAHVFEMLMRLRQVCDHSGLVFSTRDLMSSNNLEQAILQFLQKRSSSSLQNARNKNANERNKENDKPNPQQPNIQGMSNDFIQETIKSLKNKELEPCVVCLDEILEPVVTRCCHVFCRGCISHVVEKLRNCPICRNPLGMDDITSVMIEDQHDLEQTININQENFKKSSKLLALLDEIHKVKERKEKCVVFSQFLGMLNLIERCLDEEGIKFRRIDGSKTLKQRAKSIEEFKDDPEITIFMISLKAGSVGLNLTAANNVILVDPWWNPAIEDQAVERVHRIGQTKPVNVIRLICEKTIEERILELHDKKKGLVNMTLQFNPEEQKRQNMQNMIYLMKNFEDQ